MTTELKVLEDIQTYQDLNELPAYQSAVFSGEHEPVPRTGLPKWSGAGAPPAKGEYVKVTMNNIGVAKVMGYFVQDGWLGLRARPVAPPEWYIRQNGYNYTGHVFGAEVAAGTVPEPELRGPNQEQLAALQQYANRHGRSWKQKLNADWMNGTDTWEPDGHLLRQVRNNYGPSWLVSKNNPIKPAEKERTYFQS